MPVPTYVFEPIGTLYAASDLAGFAMRTEVGQNSSQRVAALRDRLVHAGLQPDPRAAAILSNVIRNRKRVIFIQTEATTDGMALALIHGVEFATIEDRGSLNMYDPARALSLATAPLVRALSPLLTEAILATPAMARRLSHLSTKFAFCSDNIADELLGLGCVRILRSDEGKAPSLGIASGDLRFPRSIR